MEEIFKNSKKIIIKIGSSTITGEDGKIDYEFLENLASEVKTLVGLEKQVVIVSSGARIAGVSTIEKWSKKEDMSCRGRGRRPDVTVHDLNVIEGWFV